MEDNGNELKGGSVTDEEAVASESNTEDDAILHEKKGPSSPRENL